MRCSCGRDIDKDWRFCAFCGKPISRSVKINFPSFNFKEDEDFLGGDMDQLSKKLSQMLNSFGIPGEVNVKVVKGMPEIRADISMNEKVSMPAKPAKSTGSRLLKNPARHVKETLEPITKETSSGSVTRFVLQLPGVNTAKDINLKQFNESIEIRAYAGERGYFKVIPIKPNSEVIEKKFANEMLKLVIRS